MTELYLIRHCEAMGNVGRIFQGSTDCDISEIGASQLEFLAERFKNIHLDAVYSSPLIRAMKTAQAVAEPKGLKVIPVQDLREMHGGVVEGKPFKAVFDNDPELLEIWTNHPQDFAPENGESMRSAYERVYAAVMEIAAANRGKTVAAAAHGGVLRCLLCRLTLGSIDRLKEMNWLDNTAVTLLRFDDDLTPQVVFTNDTSHLPQGCLPKGSRIGDFTGDAK